MIKIAILFENYGPYHLARFDSFQKYCKNAKWNLIGIELTRSGVEYDWKTQLDRFSNSIISVIGDKEPNQIELTDLLRSLNSVLTKVNPDILVIAGYANTSMLIALLWSKLHSKQAILLSASKEDDTPRNWYQEIIKSLIIKQYKSALVGGQVHKLYLEKLSMNSNAIYLGYDVVDNSIFHPDRIKKLPNLIAKPYFLTINRFIPKKNLLFLLSCYQIYKQKLGHHAWDLVICGDGQLRLQIEQTIARFNLQDCVHLPGFLQQEEILPYFAHAKCFIHASIQEQWGLVVNEAMAAGLPVLVSNRCGCYQDLIIEGVNGFGFDPENSQQLVNLMLKISSDNFDLTKMGQTGLDHIQKFSPDYFAEGLAQAIQYALAN